MADLGLCRCLKWNIATIPTQKSCMLPQKQHKFPEQKLRNKTNLQLDISDDWSQHLCGVSLVPLSETSSYNPLWLLQSNCIHRKVIYALNGTH